MGGFFFFFFNDTATTEIYTLSLHDALPILNAPLYMPCGPPWISMISGYFLVRSNPGGLMIHPSTRVPPVDVYHRSSTDPSRIPCSTSAFTFVRRLIGWGWRRLNRTTSGGSSASERTPTALKSRDTDV